MRIKNLEKLNIDIFDLGLDAKYSSFFRTVTSKQVVIAKNKELLTKVKRNNRIFVEYTGSAIVSRMD